MEKNIKIINKLQRPLQWGTEGVKSRREDNFDDVVICCDEWIMERLKNPRSSSGHGYINTMESVEYQQEQFFLSNYLKQRVETW